MLPGQSRLLVKEPENPAGSFSPEIVEHPVLVLTVCSLVLEISHDTWAGQEGDLSGHYKPVQVIPQGILVDTGHTGEGIDIDTWSFGDCMVDTLPCFMLQHILPRNSPVSPE